MVPLHLEMSAVRNCKNPLHVSQQHASPDETMTCLIAKEVNVVLVKFLEVGVVLLVVEPTGSYYAGRACASHPKWAIMASKSQPHFSLSCALSGRHNLERSELLLAPILLPQ
jgi:hypothetical protein